MPESSCLMVSSSPSLKVKSNLWVFWGFVLLWGFWGLFWFWLQHEDDLMCVCVCVCVCVRADRALLLLIEVANCRQRGGCCFFRSYTVPLEKEKSGRFFKVTNMERCPSLLNSLTLSRAASVLKKSCSCLPLLITMWAKDSCLWEFFSRKILQAAPAISLLAVLNLCLHWHSFVKMPREKETGLLFMCILNCCHKQRPWFIGLGIHEVNAVPTYIIMRRAGERVTTGMPLFLETFSWWVWGPSELQTNWKQPIAAPNLKVSEGKVKPPLLSFLPFECGVWASMLLGGGIGHLPWKGWRLIQVQVAKALRRPTLQGFAAWLCCWKRN